MGFFNDFFPKRFSIKFWIWKSNEFFPSFVWHLKTGPKSKKWSESIRRIFSKRGTNVNCALLIFVPRSTAHLQPKKIPNRTKSNYSFHWKLNGNRTLILAYLDSSMAIFDFGYLQGVYWGQSWTKNSNFGCIPSMFKIEFFQRL